MEAINRVYKVAEFSNSFQSWLVILERDMKLYRMDLETGNLTRFISWIVTNAHQFSGQWAEIGPLCTIVTSGIWL